MKSPLYNNHVRDQTCIVKRIKTNLKLTKRSSENKKNKNFEFTNSFKKRCARSGALCAAPYSQQIQMGNKSNDILKPYFTFGILDLREMLKIFDHCQTKIVDSENRQGYFETAVISKGYRKECACFIFTVALIKIQILIMSYQRIPL